MKPDKRVPFEPYNLGLSLYYKKPKQGDKSMTRRVFMVVKGRETLVGYIFLPDPKIMRYAFKTLWMTHPSTERFKTLSACKAGLGAKL